MTIPIFLPRMGEAEFRRIEHEQLARVVAETAETAEAAHRIARRRNDRAAAKSRAAARKRRES